MPALTVTAPPPPVSLAQLTTPCPLTVNFPLLVKPVQSRVERVRPPADWMPDLKVEVAVDEVALITGKLRAV